MTGDEPDEGTPPYITRAAVEALGHGETFYVQTHGMPVLREAIARYLERLHGQIPPIGDRSWRIEVSPVSRM